MNAKIKHVSPQDFGKVAVLMGGFSSEREISLLSGKMVLAALLQKGIDAYGIDVDYDIVDKLKALQPARVFNALHGIGGEDGAIQGLLEYMNLPYTGSGVRASALAMDKYSSKLLFRESGLPTLPSLLIENDETIHCLREDEMDFSLPWCVKPANGGSTVGVSQVNKFTEIVDAYNNAIKYDPRVIIEPWVAGREFTVAVLGKQALPAVEIVPANTYYDYAAKYLSDETQYFCPSNLAENEVKKIQDITLRAFNALGCRHIGRADFIRDSKGNFWLLEMNTIPGLTNHSLFPMAALASGLDYPNLIWEILAFTL